MGRDQPLGVGVARGIQQGSGLPAFNRAPGIQHNHLVGHFGHHPQIMTDDQQRHAGFMHQILQQREDLRLYGQIKRCCRLVCHQQPGFQDDGHCDHHPLALPAA